MRKVINAVYAFLSFLVVASVPSHSDELLEQFPDTELLDRIVEGGFVLYFRHAETDTGTPDQPEIDHDDCSTQRSLNDDGRRSMQEVGQHLVQLGWSATVDEVIVSPFCRTRDSASLLFPDHTQRVDHLQMYTASLTSEQKAPINERTRSLLSRAVPVGRNRVIVAHGPNIAEIMDYFPDEGALMIFWPEGDQFRYLATIRVDQWARILDSR